MATDVDELVRRNLETGQQIQKMVENEGTSTKPEISEGLAEQLLRNVELTAILQSRLPTENDSPEAREQLSQQLAGVLPSLVSQHEAQHNERQQLTHQLNSVCQSVAAKFQEMQGKMESLSSRLESLHTKKAQLEELEKEKKQLESFTLGDKEHCLSDVDNVLQQLDTRLEMVASLKALCDGEVKKLTTCTEQLVGKENTLSAQLAQSSSPVEQNSDALIRLQSSIASVARIGGVRLVSHKGMQLTLELSANSSVDLTASKETSVAVNEQQREKNAELLVTFEKTPSNCEKISFAQLVLPGGRPINIADILDSVRENSDLVHLVVESRKRLTSCS